MLPEKLALLPFTSNSRRRGGADAKLKPEGSMRSKGAAPDEACGAEAQAPVLSAKIELNEGSSSVKWSRLPASRSGERDGRGCYAPGSMPQPISRMTLPSALSTMGGRPARSCRADRMPIVACGVLPFVASLRQTPLRADKRPAANAAKMNDLRHATATPCLFVLFVMCLLIFPCRAWESRLWGAHMQPR